MAKLFVGFATAVVSIATALGQVAGVNGQIWLAPGPAKAGTGRVNGNGAYTNPYVGDFDTVLSNAPSFTDIHLLPGTFWTVARNSYSLKAGQRLLGSGIDISIIRRDPKLSTNGCALIITFQDGVEVSDLTVDCNATNHEVGAFNGINLYGSHETIRRVKCINPSGDWDSKAEMFALGIGGLTTNYCSHNLISECHVAQVRGNYGNGIGIFGQQAMIESCLVEFPPMNNTQPPFFYAYGAGKSVGATISHNTATGGSIGFYTDSYWDTNLTIAGNMFIGARQGINISKSSTGVYGLNILNNTIELAPRTSRYAGCGIALWATNGLFNVNITGNLIHFQNDITYPLNRGLAALTISTNAATNVTNLKVIYNTVGTNMTVHAGTTKGVFIGNTDTRGNLIPVTP